MWLTMATRSTAAESRMVPGFSPLAALSATSRSPMKANVAGLKISCWLVPWKIRWTAMR